MLLQGKIKDIFNDSKRIQLGTASAAGVPNVCHIGCKMIREDGKIVIIDNYMNKTKANVLENPNVAILMMTEEAYQIKGVCTYVDEGEEYEAARQWMMAKSDKYPAKGALVIEVTDAFNSIPGSNAGERIAS